MAVSVLGHRHHVGLPRRRSPPWQPPPDAAARVVSLHLTVTLLCPLCSPFPFPARSPQLPRRASPSSPAALLPSPAARLQPWLWRWRWSRLPPACIRWCSGLRPRPWLLQRRRGRLQQLQPSSRRAAVLPATAWHASASVQRSDGPATDPLRPTLAAASRWSAGLPAVPDQHAATAAPRVVLELLGET